MSQLATSLGLDAFYVEGWSAGGLHALACAWYLPQRVKAVALIASAAPMERGGAMLEALKRCKLFVVPLDDSRQWYRYHRLFAAVL